jgi:ketosteroid isomerase-like protein
MAALGPALFAQSKTTAQTVDPALQKAIDSRRAARVAKDIAAWERLTADDAMEVHSDGRVHTKAEESAEIKGSAVVQDTQDTDKRIRMYGSTAVSTHQRNPPEGPRRVVTVWAKNASGEWQAVHTQQAVVSKK